MGGILSLSFLWAGSDSDVVAVWGLSDARSLYTHFCTLPISWCFVLEDIL